MMSTPSSMYIIYIYIYAEFLSFHGKLCFDTWGFICRWCFALSNEVRTSNCPFQMTNHEEFRLPPTIE